MTVLSLALLSALDACVSRPPPAPPPAPAAPVATVRPHKPKPAVIPPEVPPAPEPAAAPVTAADFMGHLALARLTLSSGPDASVASPDISAIATYLSQPGLAAQQDALIMSYKLPGMKAMQQLFLPLPPDRLDTDGNAPLFSVMTRLENAGYILHELRVARLILTSDASQQGDISNLAQALDREQRQLLTQQEPLAPLDEAHSYLQLASFFMEKHFRDAAYLSIEDAKQALALATRQQPNDPRLDAMSGQLEALESELYRTLPFTLR